MAQITGLDVQGMITHWLETPVNGYLGSDYGQDAKSMLQTPMLDGLGDAYIAKLRADVTVIQSLPPRQVNLYSAPIDYDKVQIVLEVGNTAFDIGTN